jgi:hypothetical protein
MKSIIDLFSIILNATGSKRVVLVLDEFEHAWSRFTGAQKFNWERTIAELFRLLESKVILVLPALPESVTLGSRPYLNMHDWKEVDLDKILSAANDNVLRVDCSESSLRKCIYSILHREILDIRGERLCSTLLSALRSYSTLGEAILDLHDQLLTMASASGKHIEGLAQ